MSSAPSPVPGADAAGGRPSISVRDQLEYEDLLSKLQQQVVSLEAHAKKGTCAIDGYLV